MTHGGVFVHPFMYWVGMDTDPRTSPEALAEFDRFYSTTHVHEVVAAHPGFVSATRFELLDQDPRGGAHAGPRWLAVYEMKDEAAAERYVKDNARPWLHRQKYSPWPPARKKAKTVWRMLWRNIATVGSASPAAESASHPLESIFIVGMNIPAETDDKGLAEFNEFYTDTHVPEVMQYGGYDRATRHELYRGFAHPEPGAPQFLAIYEADEAATEERVTRRASRPTLSAGPPAWEQHDVMWRLVYRRIPPPPSP